MTFMKELQDATRFSFTNLDDLLSSENESELSRFQDIIIPGKDDVVYLGIECFRVILDRVRSLLLSKYYNLDLKSIFEEELLTDFKNIEVDVDALIYTEVRDTGRGLFLYLYNNLSGIVESYCNIEKENVANVYDYVHIDCSKLLNFVYINQEYNVEFYKYALVNTINISQDKDFKEYLYALEDLCDNLEVLIYNNDRISYKYKENCYSAYVKVLVKELLHRNFENYLVLEELYDKLLKLWCYSLFESCLFGALFSVKFLVEDQKTRVKDYFINVINAYKESYGKEGASLEEVSFDSFDGSKRFTCGKISESTLELERDCLILEDSHFEGAQSFLMDYVTYEIDKIFLEFIHNKNFTGE